MSNLPPNPYDRTVIVEPGIDNPDRAETLGSGRNFVVSLKPEGTPGREFMFLAADGTWVPFTTTDFTSWGAIIGNINNQLDLMALFSLYSPTDDFAAVAFSGQYNDLLSKPVFGDVAFINTTGGTSAFLRADGTWQIPVDVNATWGNITGSISTQADLVAQLALKAPVTNPIFQGNPRAPNPAVDNNSDSIATTAWMFGQAFNGPPVMDGVASSGDSLRWARGNHRHPTDDTRAPLDSPIFINNPQAPTPPPGNSTPRVATTAFVAAAILAAGLTPPPSDNQTYGFKNGAWIVIDPATKWDNDGT